MPINWLTRPSCEPIAIGCRAVACAGLDGTSKLAGIDRTVHAPSNAPDIVHILSINLAILGTNFCNYIILT